MSICEYPKANPVISNPLFHHSSLRKTVVDKYVIVYIFDEGIDIINIVRVIYARQGYDNEISFLCFGVVKTLFANKKGSPFHNGYLLFYT